MKRLMLSALILFLLFVLISEYTLRTHALVPPSAAFAIRTDPVLRREQAAFLSGLHFSADGVYLEPGDYHGVHYSAAYGIRTTTGQPVRWTNTVYLLGPSTVLDVWNPDAWTIASQLQTYIPSYRVVNLGVQGGSTASQVARLGTVTLVPGDIVILYSGDAEARYAALLATAQSQRVYAASPCPWMLGSLGYLALVQSGCAWWNNPPLSDAELLQAIQAELPAYRRWVDQIRQTAARAGASFVMVLAPSFTAMPLSAYEQGIGEPYRLMLANERLAYPVFEQAFPQALDLTHLLDAYRRAGHAIYYDPWHVSGDANAIIARRLAEALAPQ